MVHLIHYKLQGYRPRTDYDRLAEAIKDVSGVWCHIPESMWLVETGLSAQQVSSRLAPFTTVGDSLFVTRIYRDWSAFSFTSQQIEWLQARNFDSAYESLASLLSPPSDLLPLSLLLKTPRRP
jgi:hypothetical protein